uniref:hypothetical protein n=1 Tax=Henriciella aquimarina TaxID=545261 RepID=UPI001F1BF84F
SIVLRSAVGVLLLAIWQTPVVAAAQTNELMSTDAGLFELPATAEGITCRDVEFLLEPDVTLVRQCGIAYSPMLLAVAIEAKCVVRGDIPPNGIPVPQASACNIAFDDDPELEGLDLPEESKENTTRWFRSAAELSFAGHRFHFTGTRAEIGRANTLLPIEFQIGDDASQIGQPELGYTRDLVGDHFQ